MSGGVVWCGLVWCGVAERWPTQSRKARDLDSEQSESPPPTPCLGDESTSRSGVMLCGVVWCGVVWCGVGWRVGGLEARLAHVAGSEE